MTGLGQTAFGRISGEVLLRNEDTTATLASRAAHYLASETGTCWSWRYLLFQVLPNFFSFFELHSYCTLGPPNFWNIYLEVIYVRSSTAESRPHTSRTLPSLSVARGSPDAHVSGRADTRQPSSYYTFDRYVHTLLEKKYHTVHPPT